MEGASEDISALDEGRMMVVRGENLHARSNGFDDWPANEDHFERFAFECSGAEENVAGKLPAVGVAEDGDVEKAEGGLFGIFYVFCEEDCAGTRAENCVPAGGKFQDGVLEAFFFEEL